MKTYTIAITTAKEAIRQPIFIVLIIAGSLLTLIFTFVPYFTFGEDIKMVKDTGLALMLILSLFLAMVTASNSIAEDIEHRTAITLLSKPINRRQFIVGKFLGIILAVALMFLILGLVFCAMVYYKVGYDAREASKEIPSNAAKWAEVIQILPGIVLTYFQVVVLSALSVAISTRLPMLVNVVVCLAVFLLGHLAPVLVAVAKESNAFELVQFTAQMAELVLPALEFFNVSSAVATGSTISLWYMAWNLLYCILYSSIGILLAFVLFEDRDLA
jgi:ABC-type transport system involved in multi-copper enzyme maturation permease subunit